MSDDDVVVFSELPPLMGFPQEEVVDPKYNCDFYTCVNKPFRVFVWCHWPGKWLVQVSVDKPGMDVVKQFTSAMDKHHQVSQDPITLMCVIRELTSESNEDATNTSSTDEAGSALHLTAGCVSAISERK